MINQTTPNYDLALDDARVGIAYVMCKDGGRCDCEVKSGGKWACDRMLPLADEIIKHIRDCAEARKTDNLPTPKRAG